MWPTPTFYRPIGDKWLTLRRSLSLSRDTFPGTHFTLGLSGSQISFILFYFALLRIEPTTHSLYLV